MDKQLNELYRTNDDVIYILFNVKKIGWEIIKMQSLYRVIYLSKVLYAFVNDEEPNIFDYYHFTTTLSGPFAATINNSIVYLESNGNIESLENGIKLSSPPSDIEDILAINGDHNKQKRHNWFIAIILLLGKYGENKIFSFTINDPLYKESIGSNIQREITFDNNENETLKVLQSFKQAFEESITDTSSISREEYLELYFDYIFSQIIK